MKFKTKNGGLPLPIFFPDATRAVVRTVDSQDLLATNTPGVLVNTYHLYKDLADEVIDQYEDIGEFMGWSGALISDSGGFQVMSLARKTNKNAVSDKGVEFLTKKSDGSQEKILFTPERSIRSQLRLGTDLLVVLDDFTPRQASYVQARETVERTIDWARRSKLEFDRVCEKRGLAKKDRPYLIGVVQGGYYQELREYCLEKLVEIGFDGLGFGGWPVKKDGKFDDDSARTISENAPEDYLLYGLGIGKPEDIVRCVGLGYKVFDCVLPTRDARHGRLYVFDAEKKEEIDVKRKSFYHYFKVKKAKYLSDNRPVSKVCDCALCKNYSRGYLAHLFRLKDPNYARLATIHNLRFYSMLMERLR